MNSAQAAPISYYLSDVPRASAVPDPESFLGDEIGEWHLRPDQIVAYFDAVDAASDRVQVVRTGRTYEGRPLLAAYVSAPENLPRLEAIREAHVEMSEPGVFRTPESTDPVVVYLGYSIHGNESSGSNAAPLVLYQLASAEDDETMRWLRNAVVILDPMMNPDGLARFAHWTNTNRSLHPNPDPKDREHDEDWPGGRTNHYHFDLNRDWVPAVHPESKARLHTFQSWRPNVLADFHEMGPNSTYFFQPGVPSRRNPRTPEENVRLTDRIADYHRAALDEIGSLYYSGEDFDDFYYGKGSTYPDVQGAVGILFEQASSRGSRQSTVNGELEFSFTIRNQMTTSFSTIAASVDLRAELLDYQRRFYQDAWKEAKGSGGWLIGDRFDPARAGQLAELLRVHGIEARGLTERMEKGGRSFEPGSAFFVPYAQRQSRLLHGLMDRSTSFTDSLFYDVSAWSLPLAFGLDSSELPSVPSKGLGPVIETLGASAGRVGDLDDPDAVAFAFSWDSYWAPRALSRLLNVGAKVRIVTRPTSVRTTEGDVVLGRGSVLVPAGIQRGPAIAPLLKQAASEDGVDVHVVTSGHANAGLDLGSPNLRAVERPKILLASGQGTSSYETGSIWHLLDARYGIRVTRANLRTIPGALSDYTHLILAGGDYRRWSEDDLAAIGGGSRPVGCWSPWSRRSTGSEKRVGSVGAAYGATGDSRPAPYESAESRRGARALGGAIFAAEVDATHPLGYGYHDPELAVFRGSKRFLSPSQNPYETVVRLRPDPLVAGYLHPSQSAAVSESASLVARKMGRGSVVLFVDHPTFRAFWVGTQRLLLNSVFFGNMIDRTPAE
ncbi:MAG: M14 family metallopeptidase [Candidatus Eisenbacteria bacterium]